MGRLLHWLNERAHPANKKMITKVPKDIWYHIHSLLPLKDAARTACVSRTFLRSWRYRPNLVFNEGKLGLNGNLPESDEVTKELNDKVDHIMKNHSGIGLRTFGLECYNLVDASYLDRWLQIAVTPAIEELILMFFPEYKTKYYDFPFSLLFNRGGNSIKHLRLSYCAFRPTSRLNFLQRLHLFEVRITGDELGCLLSNSFALEQLKLTHCKELNYLKIPCVLQRLSTLTVFGCTALQVIEIKAPNLSNFDYDGNLVGLSDGGLLPVKNLYLSSFYQHNIIEYTCAKLSSIAPTIETLTIFSESERFNTQISPFRFLHLKCMTISLNISRGGFSPSNDYLSLAYFLDASPVLEIFTLTVSQTCMKHDVISEDSSHLRQIPGHRHDNLKNVKIIGFCSAKSMVELTCHIIENATSLERLTLDTICDDYENPDRLSVHEIGECSPIYKQMIMEAKNALLAIERYIVGKVPSTVRLDVLKPCNGLVASLAKRKVPPCQGEDDYQGVKRMRNPWTFLPEDIWYHIHSLLPLKDAARIACVSRTFLRSWRCRPNLIFSKKTLGLDGNSLEKDNVIREFSDRVDHIMKNHSGIGLRTFGLESYDLINASYVNRWLQIAVTPALEELMIHPEHTNEEITTTSHAHFYWMRVEARLNIFVSATLVLTYCDDLNYLKIPCLLQRLSNLEVYGCKALQVMESKAPNLSTFRFGGNIERLSDGGLLPVKNLNTSSLFQYNCIYYACAKLPSIVPTIETLKISSDGEIPPPQVLDDFSLHIPWSLSPAYDYLSLAYFLDACPFLETFTLTVSQACMKHEVISKDSSHLRQIPGHSHENLKNVKILSMIELACHILENATSLECLTLDTIHDDYENPDRQSAHEVGGCSPIYRPMIMDAKKALLAIKRYIVKRVPPTVKLDVLKPCKWCHAAGVKRPEGSGEEEGVKRRGGSCRWSGSRRGHGGGSNPVMGRLLHWLNEMAHPVNKMMIIKVSKE
uniref:F-box domain-containing protein n=1 Tax=Oryza punctata TaxID=4537 RepID=A0A0E0L507_ORYPU